MSYTFLVIFADLARNNCRFIDCVSVTARIRYLCGKGIVLTMDKLQLTD